MSVSSWLEMSQVWSLRRCKLKGKIKVRPRTGHEGPEGEKYSSTLSLTSALYGGGWLTSGPGGFTVGKETHCIGGLVGPRTDLEGCRKFRPRWDSIPETSGP